MVAGVFGGGTGLSVGGWVGGWGSFRAWVSAAASAATSRYLPATLLCDSRSEQLEAVERGWQFPAPRANPPVPPHRFSKFGHYHLPYHHHTAGVVYL